MRGADECLETRASSLQTRHRTTLVSARLHSNTKLRDFPGDNQHRSAGACTCSDAHDSLDFFEPSRCRNLCVATITRPADRVASSWARAPAAPARPVPGRVPSQGRAIRYIAGRDFSYPSTRCGAPRPATVPTGVFVQFDLAHLRPRPALLPNALSPSVPVCCW